MIKCCYLIYLFIYLFIVIYLFAHTLLYQRHTSNWRCVHNVVHVYTDKNKQDNSNIQQNNIYKVGNIQSYNHTELIQDVCAVHARFRYDFTERISSDNPNIRHNFTVKWPEINKLQKGSRLIKHQKFQFQLINQ